MIEEADTGSRVAAAKAAQQIGETAQAAALLKAAAEDLDEQKQNTEGLELWVEAAQLDPKDLVLRTRLARACVKAGDVERARLFLTAETAGDDPDLLQALAQMELAAGRHHDARALFTRLAARAPDRQDEVIQLALELARAGQLGAFGCVDVVADAALLAGDWDRAIATVQAFVQEVPHIPALIKLVELSIDAGLATPLRDAQGQLADAYLQAGKGSEARIIAEDFLDQDPGSEVDVRRLRTALELLGVPDPDAAIAERLKLAARDEELIEPVASGEPIESAAADVPARQQVEAMSAADVRGAESLPAARPEPVEHPTPEARDDEFVVLEALEVDLSEAVADIGALSVKASAPSARDQASAPSDQAPGPPRDLESVFEGIRTTVSREQQASDAAAQYDRAVASLREGRADEAIADFQAAARVPQLRFKAAAALGRLFIGRSELKTGVDWLERAAEAPAPTPDEGFALLYELADTLERLGESARALAIMMELDADAGSYRDVRSRIEQLARTQAGSHGP